MTERRYDVVLYGATGFVGKQTVQYFAQHTRPDQVCWAIAGRDRQKLNALKHQVGTDVDVLVADSQDQSALAAIAAQTRVVLSTAGPFALYGDLLVAACIRSRTHYVDITGETPWVRSLIDRHHKQAASDGTRIIPCCGFDSVPSDLGTHLVVRHLHQELGVACRQVKAYFQMDGGFNGGTLASGFNLYDSGQVPQISTPFLLNPPGEHSHQEVEQNRDPEYPQYDADIGAWVGPFFMGPINTRVVRRSSALSNQWQEPYGRDFAYQEYLKFNPPLAWLQALGVNFSMIMFTALIQQAPLRRVIQPLLPQPGSGPSEKTMNEGWFRCELLGIAESGRRARGLICDQGDPGNRATVKFLCESALSLALNQNDLPGGRQRGGILTPTTGLGNVLVERLRGRGMTLEASLL